MGSCLQAPCHLQAATACDLEPLPGSASCLSAPQEWTGHLLTDLQCTFNL